MALDVLKSQDKNGCVTRDQEADKEDIKISIYILIF